VELVQKNLKTRVWFWSILGPFLTMLTFFVSLLKFSPWTFYLPTIALVGIPLCCFARTRGLWIALSLLALALLIFFSRVPMEERFWHLGVAMAVALTFVVSTLSFEEVDTQLRDLEVESGSRLHNVMQLDGKLKEVDGYWRLQQATWERKIEQLVAEAEKWRLEAESFRRQWQSQQGSMSYLKDEYTHETSKQQGMVNSLEEQLQSALQQNRLLSEQIDKERTAAAEWKHKFQEHDSRLYKKIYDSEGAVEQVRNEHAGAQQQIMQLQDQLQTAVSEKRQLKALYDQLRAQFAEKNDVLHLARTELFKLQEELQAHKKEHEERQLVPTEMEQRLVRDLAALEGELQAKEGEVEALQMVVNRLMHDLAKQT
jgi:chromosome segregation ATPase